MNIKITYKTEGDYLTLVSNTGDKLNLDLSDNREYWFFNLELTAEGMKGFSRNATKQDYIGSNIIIDGGCWDRTLTHWSVDNFKGVKTYFKTTLANEFKMFLEVVYK
jgi:hypothetical protein